MFWLGCHPAHLPFPPIPPAPSYHKQLCAHICTCQPICASSDPLPLASSGAAGRGPCWCNLFLEGWPWGRSSNGPGEEAQTALEWNSRIQGGGVGEMMRGLWVCTSPSPRWLLPHGEGTAGGGPDGGSVATLAVIEPTLPKRQWTSGQRDSLGRRW